MSYYFIFSETQYKLYPERWWIVICVALVYGGNYCHWIAIPSVGRVVAQYYNQPGNQPVLSQSEVSKVFLIDLYD